MGVRDDIVSRAYGQLGVDYYSMNYSSEWGYAGWMGTNYVGAGWGCAQLAAYCYNSTIGTDYVGSAWNFAGDALGQGTNQGGGQFYFVDDPEPGDVVAYIQPGYNGSDYDDYGHIAVYVGDGMVVGAMGVGKPYESGYINIGVSETSVGEQDLGGGWRYLRCSRLDGAEPAPAPVIPEQHAGQQYNDLGLWYRAHCENAGWMEPVHDGQTAGSVGYSARLEAIKITPPKGVTLNVMLHIEDLGDVWYDGVGQGISDPVMGTEGQSRRVEGICINVTTLPPALEGCKLYYRVHMADLGWSSWVQEGGYAGTKGEGRRVEAVQMRFQPEQDASDPKSNAGLLYQVHVQDYGWLPTVRDGMVAGTTGQSRRIEAIRFADPPIEFDATVHCENRGDINAHVGNGVTVLGTVGESLRMEAITLKGSDRLRYQAHVQDVGWTRECKAGELCGTTGQSKRIEAVRIWLV